jgi:hypothetical protein
VTGVTGFYIPAALNGGAVIVQQIRSRRRLPEMSGNLSRQNCDFSIEGRNLGHLFPGVRKGNTRK